MSAAVAQPIGRRFGTEIKNNLAKSLKPHDNKKEMKKKAEKPKPVVTIPVVAAISPEQAPLKRSSTPSTPSASPKETPKVYCKEYLMLFKDVNHSYF
jgi:hypothetical protein